MKENSVLVGWARLRSHRFAALALLSVLLSGCVLGVGPRFKTPATPVAETYRVVADRKLSGEPVDPRAWWRVFDDPVLTQLIDTAYAQNLDLQTAGLRIVEARSASFVNKMLYFPFIGGGGSAKRTKFSQNVKPDIDVTKPTVNLGPLAQRALDRVDISKPEVRFVPYLNTYSLATVAAWEPDIWGKNAHRVRRGFAELGAATADYNAVLVSLAAEVAANYVQYRTFAEQRARLERNIALLTQALQAAQERDGALREMDIALAQALLSDTRAKLPVYEAAQRRAENALCVLLGKAPQDLADVLGASKGIPIAPASTPAGAPADLLRRRPDVTRAEFECAAQCEAIGIAKTRYLPSFSLSSMLGYMSTDFDKLTEHKSWTGSIGAGFDVTGMILYPITHEGQRIEAARFQEAVFQYQQTVLNAAREVEDAGAAFAASQAQLALLAEGAKSAQVASESSIKHYKKGETDFTYVLTSYEYLVDDQDLEAQTRGEVALNLIAFYRALGGGWETDQARPIVTEQTKEQLKKNAEWFTFFGNGKLSPLQPETSGE